MKRENPISILIEEIGDEVLKRMPEWFRRLKEAYDYRLQMLVYKQDINSQSNESR